MEELPRAVTAVLASVPRWKSLIRRRHCPHGVLLVNRLRRLRILVFHRKTASRFPQGVASLMSSRARLSAFFAAALASASEFKTRMALTKDSALSLTCEAPPRDKALSLVSVSVGVQNANGVDQGQCFVPWRGLAGFHVTVGPSRGHIPFQAVILDLEVAAYVKRGNAIFQA